MRADLARSLDQFLLTFLEGYGFADFLLDISTMFSGNSDADVTSYRRTFLGREWDAGLLLLDAAILLGVVRALLTIDAIIAGNILTLGKRFLMTNLLGYLVTDGFGDVDANGSHDRSDGSHDRSNRSDGRKEETFRLLGRLQDKHRKSATSQYKRSNAKFFYLFSLLLGLLGGKLFVQAPSPPLGLGDYFVTTFLDGSSMAVLMEMGYADILFDGMASLLEDG